jgi:hypothetical protein
MGLMGPEETVLPVAGRFAPPSSFERAPVKCLRFSGRGASFAQDSFLNDDVVHNETKKKNTYFRRSLEEQRESLECAEHRRAAKIL